MSPELRATLSDALIGGTHTMDDVVVAISASRMQLWTEGRSAIVTQIYRYPQLTALEMFLMAGALDELKVIEERITDTVRCHGIDRVQLGGRPGWQRALPGYESLGVFLVKDI